MAEKKPYGPVIALLVLLISIVTVGFYFPEVTTPSTAPSPVDTNETKISTDPVQDISTTMVTIQSEPIKKVDVGSLQTLIESYDFSWFALASFFILVATLLAVGIYKSGFKLNLNFTLPRFGFRPFRSSRNTPECIGHDC